ncbi:S9 family peptidase [Agrococcus baldri]|uniref:Dipeptidyl aminopeptidase/acylaminoacyl peptidase n=1 Tax=Agrococcus baldri TaxID=153730 RepID=A0AA87REP8_9MICO|nr:alpha/beta fold hydrolase [Agrococcus baldri]GEK79211.1 dipeptidyl aminopeptidase/acylaminoacyl peptidase [Agrococcus baldri]
MPDDARFHDFTDIEGLLRVPRLASVAASPGGRAVAAIQQADEHGARMVSSLWELDPTGEREAQRLTWSAKGESAPRFAPDGALLFSSARPDPTGDADDDAAAIWRLPERGEAHVVASAPGGLTLAGVAADGTLLATTEVLAGGTLEGDAEARAARKHAKRTAIWHTGMPIRHWDHEVSDVSPRLVLVSPEGELRELTPGADTVSLLNASADLSPDGRRVATTWMTRQAGGETRTAIALIDVQPRRRRTLLRATAAHQWSGPRFSPDGDRIAVTRLTASSPSDTSYDFLEIHPIGGGEPVAVDVGDVTIGEYRWLDADRLLVAGDLHSRGAVLLVDARTGRARTLVDDAVYASLAPAGDGSAVLALRSDMATPARPVRLPLQVRGRGGARPVALRAPGEIGALPGRLEWIETDVDGVVVGGWLCTPKAASTAEPAPVMLWIHGGPHGSYNAWSWRWNPWLAVARGYAVLLPDPAMSTGYGHAGLNRGWPRLADVVWRECEALLDRVLRRATLDGERTALLGASFGGYMTNWIAGHSDRFDAIVTHAGLWALDQQHATTDAAALKVRVHGHPDLLPDWYRAYSPHHHASAITTPMLITHGNRDYRVPVSEALRMWWDLVSAWPGAPGTMPHRFLQLTDENHWVLRPSNAVTWNETALAFCDQHVRGGAPVPDALPW